MSVRQLLRIVVLGVCVVFTGCAVVLRSPPLRPIEDPTRRIEFQGFSVLPPQGEGWGFAFQTGYQAMIGKKTFDRRPRKAEEMVTAFALVNTVTLTEEVSGREDFMRWLEELERQDEDKARGVITRYEVSPRDSDEAVCVGSRWREEDRKVPSFPGHLFVTDTRTAACIHPSHPRMVAFLSFSQRLPSGAETPDMTEEGEAFLTSLAFSPLEKPFVEAIIPVGRMPSCIAGGFGSLWVAVMDDNEVARIDPRTNNVVARIPVGKAPVGIAVDFGRVWVSNELDGTLSVIAPETDEVAATIKVGKRPLSVLSAEGSIWVVNSGADSVSRVDPGKMEVSDTIEVGKEPSGMAAGAGHVWVTNGSSHTVSKIDPRSGRAVWSDGYVGRYPVGICFVNGLLWVAASGNNEVVLMDPESGSVVDGVTMGRQPCGLTEAGGLVWVVEYGDNAVKAIDPVTKQIRGRALPVGTTPATIHFFDGDLWVSCREEGSIYRFRP